MGLVDLENICQILIRAAHAGGEKVLHNFGQVLEITEKSHVSDVQTRGDTESEAAILRIIRQELPEFTIYSEESGIETKNSAYTVVIDPLDGSNNFVLGIPLFSVSIALMKNDETVIGIVYVPVLSQTCSAVKGNGTFMNGTQLHVSQESDLTRATISYSCNYQKDRDYEERVLHKLNEKRVKRYIRLWSPAFNYCLIAAGKVEGIISNGNELYDYAAGKLIIREAGGKLTGFNGEQLKSDKEGDIFIASNGTSIHDELVKVVAL